MTRKRGRGVRALIPDLADGSHQGNGPPPTMAVFAASAVALVELQERLDQAMALLRQLERMLTAAGGYMVPEDQDALRAARAFLVDRAK